MPREHWIPDDATDDEADDLVERAAIKEFCGNTPRETAEAQAVAERRERQARCRHG